jgi:hypothetical protein
MNPSRRPTDEQPRPQDKPAQRIPFMRQLDRVASEINPLLMIFMIGLGILDLTCYVGLEISRNQHAHAPAQTVAAYHR